MDQQQSRNKPKVDQKWFKIDKLTDRKKRTIFDQKESKRTLLGKTLTEIYMGLKVAELLLDIILHI